MNDMRVPSAGFNQIPGLAVAVLNVPLRRLLGRSLPDVIGFVLTAERTYAGIPPDEVNNHIGVPRCDLF
jgi:hypothetical protein